MPLVSLHQVHKRYPTGTEALSGVSFSIEPGEFVFLSGPSGAGKSTLLRLLLHMEIATKGDVLLFGRNLAALSRSSVPYLRRNIGAIFQDFRLLPDRTVFENVAVGLHILGLSRKEIKQRVTNTLYDLSIDRYAQAFPSMLSGGEQQRVAIARALVMHPALILADEPTGNLDWELSNDIVRLFDDLNAKGTTVIMATHDRFLLNAFPRRTLLLNKGFLIEDFQPSQTNDDETEEGVDEEPEEVPPIIQPLDMTAALRNLHTPPPLPKQQKIAGIDGEEVSS
ncbi:MAG: Cell division ATP-binding protein FtsE [Deltaproteobacteria bacterium ADurb.Bin058]|nr:MAG: Cell division ATP-binding protein FtsE [Deltaproteobacteria bacterium ADurb.Bin058]